MVRGIHDQWLHHDRLYGNLGNWNRSWSVLRWSALARHRIFWSGADWPDCCLRRRQALAAEVGHEQLRRRGPVCGVLSRQVAEVGH